MRQGVWSTKVSSGLASVRQWKVLLGRVGAGSRPNRVRKAAVIHPSRKAAPRPFSIEAFMANTLQGAPWLNRRLRMQRPNARANRRACVMRLGRRPATPIRKEQGLNPMLADKDRIFTNLYGFEDWGLDAARKRGAWDG